jgi:choline dehydrogenase
VSNESKSRLKNGRNLEFDYVIVGSGSAGSALAYRIAEAGRDKVLVLEFGGSDWGPLIQMPSALSYPMNMRRYDWGFVSEPEPHLNGRRLNCPRGKVIGGSSSVNGMVYVRGHAGDYDQWEALGARGWGFRDVLPYFKRMETSHGGEDHWRGRSGPMHVTRGEWANPLYDAFVCAGIEAGYHGTADINGSYGEGFGAMERTVYEGKRWSAADAYLKPSIATGKVKLEKGALALGIAFEGKRAVGVEFSKNGEVRFARARKEVILSASSINSPKLLQLSGVGDPARLRSLGINVMHELPGVGENLQDHPEVHIQWECTQPITLNKHMNVLSKALIGMQWLLFKNGLGATNHFEACAFIRHKAGIKYPNLEYHFLPGAIQYDGKSTTKGHGFQVLCAVSRPRSRGFVRVRSADPKEAPAIQYNFFDDRQDWEEMRAGLRLIREIMAMPAMAPFAGAEIRPGKQVETNEQIDAYIREKTESAYHLSGTCRMGSISDRMAVVDPECRVIGLEALRVVDSSIIPLVTMGNINAPSLLIGEKAADHILDRAPLPAANNEPLYHPRWQTEQR